MTSRGAPAPWPLTAVADPGAPAVVAPEGALSYTDLDRHAGALAGALARRGIASGDRVGLLLDPGRQLPVLFWALWRLGAVACPVSTRLPPPAVGETLAGVGARLLVTDRPEASLSIATSAGELAAEASRAGPATAGPFRPEAPATVLFTSGSTGPPKAVLHTVGSHQRSARGANGNLPLGPGRRWLLSLPTFHAGGLAILWRAADAGAAVAVAPPEMSLAESLAVLAPTHLSLVPTQLKRLLRAPDGPWRRRLAGVLVGGAAAPATLLLEARRQGIPVVATYGTTETGSQVTATRPGDPPEALRTSGHVLPYREVAVAPDGEILVRGGTLAAGYLAGGMVTPLTDPAGWYHTGDLGAWAETGRLRVTGRRDNLFISGGENIHPEMVERALDALEGVARSMVVAVPHTEYGHRPVAFVELDDGTPPDDGALRARLAATGHLPRFMLPDHILPWPRGEDPGIKPDRQRLTALAAATLAAKE